MHVVYQLKNDTRHIEQVQRATRTTSEFGVEPTHGMFGSDEWWQAVESGSLALHTLKGTIKSAYMAGMNDWPEFCMISDSGEESRWTRETNTPESDALYAVGNRVEIDYVLQRHRPDSWSGGAEFKKVIEIRIADQSSP